MNKNLILLILSTLIFSCSQDDSNSETPSEIQKIYAYNNSSKKIVELNPEDGSEIEIIADIPIDNVYFTNITYSQESNEIIGTIQESLSYPEYNFYFVKVNVTNGNVNINLIDYHDYRGLTMTNEGKLYTYRSRSTDRKIVELDPNNGSEIRIIKDLDLTFENDFSGNMVYSEATDELIGIQYLIEYHPTTFTYWLTRINISNGNFTPTILNDRYEDIFMTDEAKLYAYNFYDDKIVELNPIDGSEMRVVANLQNSSFQKIVYSETANELIGILSSDFNYRLARVNMETGQITQVPLEVDNYDFVLGN